MSTAFPQYAQLFLSESREHLSAINHSLLALEHAGRGESASGVASVEEAIAVVFRSVHTIKGMSATMGFAAIAELSHELESLLDRLRRGELRITQSVTDVLFACADALERGVEDSVAGRADAIDTSAVLARLRHFGQATVEAEHAPVAQGGAQGGAQVGAQVDDDVVSLAADADAGTAVEGAPPSHSSDVRQRSVRVEARRLDTLMDLVGELVIARGRLQELSARSGDETLAETVTRASRVIGALRDEIMTSRLVPVWQVFDRFPRFVRDAARSAGKTIDLTVTGKEIELDRSMLDEVGDPIVHLLRNAIDHGIETPAERAAAGKPPAGRLLLSAERDRATVVIRVSDDGRGIDRERVLRAAKDAGLVDAARTELTDEEVARLVARAGFSTAQEVTGMSGRGVGVDAVHTRVRALGGSVEIRSVVGRGTTVTLRLPLTLAMQRAILARVSDERYAIPTTHVRETIEVQPQAVTMLRGREVLMHRDDVLPVIRLRRVMGLPATLPGGELEQAVVIELAEKRAVLVVDDLLGQQEIVVKQVDQIRDGLRCFSGATILGDGAPALILDVGSLS
ncbi:MAG TPA: chemotaxis protein CheA [Gemmatimonadaceae bacterium]|nr:chemotaxis protein CheA [Gemmatimonadaceae bacterium]